MNWRTRHDFVVDRSDDTEHRRLLHRANDCSLRGAITLANARRRDRYHHLRQQRVRAGHDHSGQHLPNITTDMNITGLGAALVTVDGANHAPTVQRRQRRDRSA